MIKYKRIQNKTNKTTEKINDIKFKYDIYNESYILSLFLNEYFIRNKWNNIFEYQFVSSIFLKNNQELARYKWKCSYVHLFEILPDELQNIIFRYL